MNKAELVSEISKKTGVSKADVLAVLNSFFEEIKNYISDGGSIYLRGFGSFIIKKKTRVGKEKCIPYFKPGKDFVDRVKESEVNKIE